MFSGRSYHPDCVWVQMMQPPFLGPGHWAIPGSSAIAPDVCPRAMGSGLLRDRATCRDHRTRTPLGSKPKPCPRPLDLVQRGHCPGAEAGRPWLLPQPGPHSVNTAGTGAPHGTPGRAPHRAGRDPRWLHPCCLRHVAPAAERPAPTPQGSRYSRPSARRPHETPKGRRRDRESPGQEGAGGDPPRILQGLSGGWDGAWPEKQLEPRRSHC